MKKLIDVFGKEVETGDIVILPVHGALEFHQVLKINDKTMKVSCLRDVRQSGRYDYKTRKYGDYTFTSLWPSKKLDKVLEHNSFVYKQKYDNMGIMKLDMKDLVNPDNIKSDKQLIKDYKVKHNIV